MHSLHCISNSIMRTARLVVTVAAMCAVFVLYSATALGHEVKDLKYGAVLFEYFQQKYFDTLVEYEYATARGGIQNHGTYPELLKGGVSLSYGLDLQAKKIFSKLIAENTPEEVQNRAWYYLAKMLYLRGDIERSATTLVNIRGVMPADIDQEYRYLAALINIKMGYYDEAEAISQSFEKDSPYAPYLYFNLGVAFGKQKDYNRAFNNLNNAITYSDGSNALDRLADRAYMAAAYLYAEKNDLARAYDNIKLVSTNGVFSNRALLGSGWASVNNGSYKEALAPLTVLQQRSMSIPEVQEAVLLVPHVYEKLGLMGRAAKGFISAYDRYSETLEQLNKARNTLKDTDILELFVRNMDQMLGESDWFGTAPSVSLNSLSPFLLDMMSDHSFQSVLKDLRDLYAIRNNLNSWKRKRDDFEVIIASRSASLDVDQRDVNISVFSKKQTDLQKRYTALALRASSLEEDDKKRVQWLLSDVQFEINSAGMMVNQLHDGPAVSMNTEDYAILVRNKMEVLEQELQNTNVLITKVENVLLELINAELDIHEERLKYYRVQSHLAKARILDRSLASLDDPGSGEQHDDLNSRQSSSARDHRTDDVQGDEDAP
jgi:tetratricopeptide (TPR) repeat protein